jgi:hypothetical protein
MENKKEDVFLYNREGTKKVNLTKSKILIKENESDNRPEKLFVSSNGNYFFYVQDENYFSCIDRQGALKWIIENYPQWLYDNPEWTEDIQEI